MLSLYYKERNIVCLFASRGEMMEEVETMKKPGGELVEGDGFTYYETVDCVDANMFVDKPKPNSLTFEFADESRAEEVFRKMLYG